MPNDSNQTTPCGREGCGVNRACLREDCLIVMLGPEPGGWLWQRRAQESQPNPTVWSGRIWFWKAAKFRDAGGCTIREGLVLNPLSWWPWISYLIKPGGVIGDRKPSAMEIVQRARKAGMKTEMVRGSLYD